MKTYTKPTLLFVLSSTSAMVGSASSQPCETVKCRAKVFREDLQTIFRPAFESFTLAIADIDDFVMEVYQPLVCDKLERCSDAERVVSAWKEDLNLMKQDIGNVEESEERVDQDLEILAETNDTDNDNGGRRLRRRQLSAVTNSNVGLPSSSFPTSSLPSIDDMESFVMHAQFQYVQNLDNEIKERVNNLRLKQESIAEAREVLALMREENITPETSKRVRDFMETNNIAIATEDDPEVELEANIQNVQDWIDSETSAIELEMVSLNSLINKRKNAFELLKKAMDSFQQAKDKFVG